MSHFWQLSKIPDGGMTVPDDDVRPNILFIESDQHNPAVIGAYGNAVIRTPNLDALAARGVVIENSYCA